MNDFKKIYLVCYKDMFGEYRAVIGDVEYVCMVSDRSQSTISRCVHSPSRNICVDVIGISPRAEIIKRNMNNDIDGKSIKEYMEERLNEQV